MIKRILRVIAFFATFPLVAIEIPLYGIRWIITGKPFPDNSPICAYFLIDE